MVILAVNEANDKGTAFESFMSIILSKLGYEIINVNVRKSGRELDIQATATVTGEPLLVECKAHRAVISGPDFSKFYGVYDHERRKNSRLFGLMVSLSGFNSEVKAYYEEKLDSVKKRFKINGPNEITELAVRADLIADDRTIKHEASKSWPFELGETILVITETQLFRIQILKKDGKNTHFIAYRAHGQAPTTHEIQTLKIDVSYIKNLEPLNIAARKELIIALAKSERPLSVARLKQRSKQSIETINAEIRHFEERKIITKRGTSFSLFPDLVAFCEIFKEGTSDQVLFLRAPTFCLFLICTEQENGFILLCMFSIFCLVLGCGQIAPYVAINSLRAKYTLANANKVNTWAAFLAKPR